MPPGALWCSPLVFGVHILFDTPYEIKSTLLLVNCSLLFLITEIDLHLEKLTIFCSFEAGQHAAEEKSTFYLGSQRNYSVELHM